MPSRFLCPGMAETKPRFPGPLSRWPGQTKCKQHLKKSSRQIHIRRPLQNFPRQLLIFHPKPDARIRPSSKRLPKPPGQKKKPSGFNRISAPGQPHQTAPMEIINSFTIGHTQRNATGQYKTTLIVNLPYFNTAAPCFHTATRPNLRGKP